MKEIDKNYSIGELQKSAPLSDTFADELKEREINRRKSLVKLIIMCILAAALIVFASIAWFASNRDVNANEMGVRLKGCDFILKVDPHPSPSEIEPPNPQDEAEFKTYYPHMRGEMVTRGYDMSALDTSEAAAIRFFIQDENTTYTDKTGIRPGSYGTVEFYAEPVDKLNFTSMELHFDVNITPYENVLTTNDSGVANITGIRAVSENAAAYRYVGSHILLFREKDSSGYSQMIDTDRGFDVTVTSSDYEKPIRVYWIWPDNFSQMVLFAGSSDLNDEPMFSAQQSVETYVGTDGNMISDTPVDRMKKFIIEKCDSFFLDVLEGDTAAERKADAALKMNDLTNNVLLFNTGYNNVDQVIGTKVGCISIELIADKG